MKQLAIITGYFFTICVLGCLIAYPIFLIIGSDFERVVSRTILFLAVLLFYPTCKCLKVKNIASIGWIKSHAAHSLTKSWILGFIMLAPISMIYYSCGFRFLESTPVTFFIFASALLSAIISGLLIGVIEESIFRGLFQSQLSQSMNLTITIIIVSVIYSSVHFLEASDNLNDLQIEWHSGFVLLASAFANLGNIYLFIDAWIALFLAGIFLSLVRIQTNNLVWCIGIHAGWVTHIKLFKEFTDRNDTASCASLASHYDNYVGELSILLIATILFIWMIVHMNNKSSH